MLLWFFFLCYFSVGYLLSLSFSFFHSYLYLLKAVIFSLENIWNICVHFTFICWPENRRKKKPEKNSTIEMAEYIGLVSTLVNIVRVFVCERMLHLTATAYRQMYWDWTISHEFTICCIFFRYKKHTHIHAHTHIFSLSSNASKYIRWLYFSPRDDDKTKQKKMLESFALWKIHRKTTSDLTVKNEKQNYCICEFKVFG